ncbi:MAG: IclR family transcriptional regulator [Desulfotomaculaceae bacterium]|nr:IclR family transcriptional regulator [Desulfotomaculaceae bacterium]
MPEDRNLVKAVLKALEILEIMCKEKNYGVRDLSRKVGLTRSTVGRMVATLEHAGYVEQEQERGKYRATLKLFELGNEVIQHQDIREKAYPLMEQISTETEETVNLAVPYGNQILYILKIDSPHMLKSTAPLGSHPPLHCSASGKVILAYLPEDKKEAFLPMELPALTPNTITSLPELEAELARVRANGYAVDNEEWSLNTKALAAPVWGCGGKLLAALAIAGPSVRMNSQQIDDMVQILLKTAGELSFNLGYRKPAQNNMLPDQV